MHTSLRPRSNIILIFIWAIIITAAIIIVRPIPWILLFVGVVLGACAGTIQLKAIRQASALLTKSETLLDVRRALISSKIGQIYIYVFWSSMTILIILSFILLRDRIFIGILFGYSAFASMRELLTLRGTIETQTISENSTRAA